MEVVRKSSLWWLYMQSGFHDLLHLRPEAGVIDRAQPPFPVGGFYLSCMNEVLYLLYDNIVCVNVTVRREGCPY